jgi:nitrogen fixation/metabolism regulation signal transduction histidine kinase
MQHTRKKCWIDRFQTSLSVRIAIYFLIYQAAVWILVAMQQRLLPNLERALGRKAVVDYGALLTVTAITLAALFIWDAVKLTHRIVGPLYRFRQVIKAITAGDEVELIRLRKGDFLEEMKGEFNEMLRVLEQRGAVVLKTPAAEQNEKDASGSTLGHECVRG